MIVMGIAGLAHDPAVAIVKDGEILFAVEEERISRVKDEWCFPVQSIEMALSYCGLKSTEIDFAAYYWDDAGSLKEALAAELGMTFNHHVPTAQRMLRRIKAAGTNKKAIDLIMANLAMCSRSATVCVNHHDAHAIYAFRTSRLDSALVVVIDGRGECDTISIYTCDTRSAPVLIGRSYMPMSLGYVYGAVTQHLGYCPTRDEYRVMGLAPLGRFSADLDRFFADLFTATDGLPQLDLSKFRFQYDECIRSKWFSTSVIKHLGPPRQGEGLTQFHADVAFALQKRYEEVVASILSHWQSVSGYKNLVLTGGCAMNSVCNGKLRRLSQFSSVYVPPAPGDQGAAIGAALSMFTPEILTRTTQRNTNAFLGPEYSDIEILSAIFTSNACYEIPTNCAEAVASLLSKGAVGAVFRGRMEFGPRALGNRSILANPVLTSTKDRVNSLIKHRESFRPFAAAIMEEYTSEYIDDEVESPYMGFVHMVNVDKRTAIPAVTHMDGSCRLQTVKPCSDLFLRDVLEQFYSITGVPLLLNTSFNVNGEPIAMSPSDAISCFQSTALDFLLIGQYLIKR